MVRNWRGIRAKSTTKTSSDALKYCVELVKCVNTENSIQKSFIVACDPISNGTICDYAESATTAANPVISTIYGSTSITTSCRKIT